MKKFFFSLLALVAMVCTAVSLTSCGDDDDNATKVVCEGVWGVEYWSTLTPELETELTDYVKQLNQRAVELFGSTIKVKYNVATDEVDEGDVDNITKKLEADSKTQELVHKILSVEDASGEYFVSYTYFVLKSGTKGMKYIYFRR